MNVDLANRIHNCKFRQTSHYWKKETKEAKELLGALENVLGNIGWFDTREDFEENIIWEEVEINDLKIILKNALQNIGYEGLIP